MRAPVAVGVKATLILQLALGARVVPQVVVRVKSPLVMVEEMKSATLSVLVSVRVCAALLVPTFCEAKVKLVGLKEVVALADPRFKPPLTATGLRRLIVVPSPS